MNENVSQKVRYDISIDKISRDRLAAIQKLQHELSTFFGQPIIVQLFGSLSKGKTLRDNGRYFGVIPRKGNVVTTDIDMSLFYDVDVFAKKHSEQLAHNTAYKKKWDSCIGTGEKVTPEDSHAFADRVIVDFDIRNHLQDSVTYTIPLISPISLEGSRSILHAAQTFSEEESADLLHALEEKTGFSHSTERAWHNKALNLARFFHLDVGGHMRTYRQHFLQQLLTLPQKEGERLWALVNASARYIERDFKVSEDAERQFPRTLDEAVRYYKTPRGGL